MTKNTPSTWIALDWGTTNLRAWLLDAEDRVVREAASDRGMGTLSPDGFETALLELVAPWLDPAARTPIVACGMVGARQGWDAGTFAATLPGALEGADALPAALFALRARTLLEGEDPVRARSRLSALLIGAELGAVREWWRDTEVVLVGATGLTDPYRTALDLAGGASRTLDADALTLAGLVAARRRLFPDLPIEPAAGARP